MSERCAITPILPAILLAAIIFLICGDCIIYKVSFPTVSIDEKDNSNSTIAPIAQVHTEPTLVGEPLQSSPNNRDDNDSEPFDSLVVPSNISGKKERIDWFRKHLPDFRILQSNNLTQKFHDRFLEFLSQKCETQFFMTWVSPARSFRGRELMAVESVFKSHPRGCLTILSRTLDSERGCQILKPLLDHGFKIQAITPDLPSLFKNTPVEAWFDELKRGKKDPGQIPLAQNLSNLMRLAVLYKYGGVYIDTDFIVLKSFIGLKNSIGAQSIDPVSKNWRILNNAVLIFDKNHPLLEKFMEDFASNFDGSRWGYNGPFLVSRVMSKVTGATARPGFNVTVLPPAAFYPVDWTKIGELFKKPENQAAASWAKAKQAQINKEAYGIHLWNKQSKTHITQKGSVIERLFSDHCIICSYT
ncbi:Lactosylceramide 4-alpha-galactosyltransferase, partial [Cucurbita argyrosperma subsp. argyrosperma]